MQQSADQPLHVHSLIRAFTVFLQNHQIILQKYPENYWGQNSQN